LKIAFITLTSTIPFGSCDLLTYRTARLAHQKGHDVFLSVNDFREKHHNNYIEIEKEGVTLHKRPMYNDSTFFTRTKFKIEYKLLDHSRHFKKCFDIQPDYIFLNNQGTYDFVHSPVADRLLTTGIPFAALSQYHPEVNGMSANYYQKARQLFTKADKLFFISNKNLETARRSLALPLPNAVEVCNPLSSDTTSYVAYPKTAVPVFCMTARFECDVKGQDIMLSVLASDYWKSKQWILNLYGEGPDKPYIEDLIKYYGLADRVFLKGYRNNIEDIWRENQMLIMPSISEGTPITLLTAIVAGRTALVTNVGGNAEYVLDNKTGFVADAPTFNCLHEAMVRAWERWHEWEAIGQGARSFGLEKIDFNPQQTVLDIITGQTVAKK
jgi:glycosyltransferase involved in cell wall biosynthesis